MSEAIRLLGSSTNTAEHDAALCKSKRLASVELTPVLCAEHGAELCTGERRTCKGTRTSQRSLPYNLMYS
ncbi:hypothetical protein BST61_g2583 [Cercospora zeina]